MSAPSGPSRLRAKIKARRAARRALWQGGTASPLEHLLEFRARFLRALAGIILASVGGWIVSDQLFSLLLQPLAGVEGTTLNFATLGAGFDARLRVAFLCGLVVAAPWWMWQLWAFVGPGLHKHERRFALGFTLAGTLCFSGGVGFAWWLTPRIVRILVGLNPQGTSSLLTAQNYLSFVLWLLVAFGVAACFPLAVLAANVLGVLPARLIFRAWRWATVACYAFGAIANPLPDAWSMLIIGSVLLVFYLLVGCIALGREKWLSRRASKRVVA